ncbi:hypothetical protein VPHD81_0014 [Vibrio phage D81]
MFDMDKVLKAAKELGGDIAGVATKYVPTALSRDKQLANAYGCTMALMICADVEVEEQETIDGMDYIRNDENLRGLGMTVEGINFYSGFVNGLKDHFDDKPQFVVETAKLIEEHIASLKEPAHKLIIRDLVNSLCGTRANDAESNMRDNILRAV